MIKACSAKYTPITGQTGALFIEDPILKEWLHVAGTTNINGPQTSVGEIDVTNMCSQAKEYIADLVDYGNLSATAQILFGSPGQWLLSQSLNNNPPDTFNIKVRLADDGLGNGEVWGYGRGYCNSFPVQQGTGAVATVEISFRLTGPWTWERPTDIGTKLRYSTTNLSESGANDGRVVQTATIRLQGDTFTGVSGEAMDDVTFTGVPAGLTALVTKASDTVAILSFSGKAGSHEEGMTDAIEVVFDDAAFTAGPAANILNSSQVVTIIWI